MPILILLEQLGIVENGREYLPTKGATGVMIRTFVEIAKSYQ